MGATGPAAEMRPDEPEPCAGSRLSRGKEAETDDVEAGAAAQHCWVAAASGIPNEEPGECLPEWHGAPSVEQQSFAAEPRAQASAGVPAPRSAAQITSSVAHRRST